MADKKLLDLKKKMKKKQPAFKHYDHQKRKKVGTRWRFPSGMHNKIRHGFNGQPAQVNDGYRTPLAVRGMTKDGLIPIRIHTLAEISTLDPKQHGVVLGKVGGKKKTALLEACKKAGCKVLNVKDVDAKIKAIADALVARKEKKTEASKKKAEKAKKAEKKAEKKEEKKADAEETQKQEKKEQAKVLTKRE